MFWYMLLLDTPITGSFEARETFGLQWELLESVHTTSAGRKLFDYFISSKVYPALSIEIEVPTKAVPIQTSRSSETPNLDTGTSKATPDPTYDPTFSYLAPLRQKFLLISGSR